MTMIPSTRRIPFAALFLCGALQAPVPPKVVESPSQHPDAKEPDAKEIGRKLDRYLVDSEYAGSVLVAKDGQILLEKAYGEADREQHVPFKTDTLVSIGSITKQFTAAAIVKLEMEGKLEVEDPITRFFADVPEDKRAITVHELLTHTAGLDSDFAQDYDPVGRDEYVRRILTSKLRSAPGTAHFYANAGYSLLGAIVEAAGKQPYEAYLHEHLFEPAGMHDTGYRMPKWDKARIPVGYRDGKRWGTMLEKPWAADGPYWALRANGGIQSTLDDLWRWSRALDGDSVLSVAAKKKMFTPHVAEEPGSDSFYGYGWTISTTPWGHRLIAHNGGNGVFSADFRRYVDDGMVVITFSNDSRVRAWKHAGALARIARGEDVAPDPPGTRKLAALGDSPRHAVIRQFVEAFNSNDIARVRSFRAEHMSPRPGGPSEEERDRFAKRMFEEMQTLTPEGVASEDSDAVTVQMKTARGDVARFRFLFATDGKIAGLQVEMGD
jgi:CubicO group peptidase (beta-lactamase class C family)